MSGQLRRVKWWVRGIGQRVAPRLLLSVLARRSWLHEPELGLLPLFAPRNTVAIDAGANKGVYLHHLARNFERVVAFEPLPALSRYLMRASPRNATIHDIALSNQPGEADLSLPKGFNELGSIEPTHNSAVGQNTNADPGADLFADYGLQEDGYEHHRVRLATLDSFGLENVGFIKIDVEGHELAVLEGARGLIADWRPAVLVEVEERHKAGGVAAVAQFFSDLEFDGYYLDGSRLRPLRDFDPDRDQSTGSLDQSVKVGRYINNFVFFHRSWSAERAANINRWLGSQTAWAASRGGWQPLSAVRRVLGGARPAAPRPQG